MKILTRYVLVSFLRNYLISFLVLIIGLYLIYDGNVPAGEPLAASMAIVYLLSMVLFGIIALPVVTGRATA